MSATAIASRARGAGRRSGRGGAARPQAGVGLIEILIAVLVLGFGLLGAAAMQSLALRNSQSSMERSQAVVQTYAIADAMRANAEEARRGLYDTGDAPLCVGAPAAGGKSALVAADLAAWKDGLGKSLGAQATTCGKIDCDAKGLCDVTVQWSDARAGSARTEDAAGKAAFTLKVRL
ncbi:type IV pilus modification protein PilV [Lysobacter enzymogenes]|uniref:type IV pilus modification protein PilV n=1 Tax=Lysobacter enzymogenes TaxID=69 RepID=UPI001A97D055|nr:type IV pilus modification protein PilV [Lysobacter enzymogenes]QQP98111.1 type IV pilus modification protein PilV [Lysobacter enzymogenes]